MRPRRYIAAPLILLAGICLAGCAGNAPVAPAGAPAGHGVDEAALAADYAQLGAQGGTVYALDAEKSAIRIYVFRGGLAAKLAHNHLISAPRFTGYFHLPRDGPAKARFDLVFRLDQLQIDAPELHAGQGPAFSATFSPGDIESTRAHMLGDENLQADQYPFVRIHSLQIVGEAPRFAARIQLELHGRQREMWVPLAVEGLPERLSVSGALVLRQSDFDVKPYTAFGGLLAVQDEIVIDFRLAGAATAAAQDRP